MADTILVPIDFSAPSRDAVGHALGLTDRDRLHVLHVLPHIEPHAPVAIWDGIDEASRIDKTHAYAANWLLEEGLGELKTHVRIGDPGTEIAAVAAELGADTVIIPTHGRRGLGRLLLGSVTERVIRLAPCAVLVLRRRNA